MHFSRNRASSNFRKDALDAEFTQYFGSARGQMRAKGFLDLVPSRCGILSGSMCCDTSQNPSVRARAGAWMPTLTRNSRMALLNSSNPYGHFFTPSELAFSQGWPRIPGSSKRYTAALGVDMSPFSMNAQQKLMGNSMHVHVVGGLLSYILAHVVRRDLVDGIVPRTLVVTISDDDREQLRKCKAAHADGPFRFDRSSTAAF